MPILVGDLIGDYKVTGVLGHGGMGKVFRVRSLLTDREEAMKVLRPDFDESPELADRVLREMKLHARLQHPNIAALRTALRIDDRLFMFVELVQGSSLEEVLRLGPLAVSVALRHINQVLSALAYSHACGVVHRDIKPANILIADTGEVKLTDFGIARATDATRVTTAGLAVGTVAYMSPEQVRAEHVDGRSDLYSLGLTFYEMITGARAIQGETLHALMNAQLAAMPTDPSALNPLVPHAVSTAIMRALAKDPEDRFQTAEEFKAALDNTHSQSRPAAIPPSQMTTAVHQPADHGSFDQSTLERLTYALATYLGPIAKVLVSRAARGARTVEELQDALAAEIPSADDRRRFLARARSAL
jgi:serine/threonine protein kinase